MDDVVVDRAKQRIADAASGHPDPARLEAALDRARAQIEALAATAAELQSSLPDQLGAAVEEGLRAEMLPAARQIAEIRGLLNHAIRRLERLEGELLAERYTRVDDLALLVELLTSGWRGLDARLERLEQARSEDTARIIGAVEDLPLPVEPLATEAEADAKSADHAAAA